MGFSLIFWGVGVVMSWPMAWHLSVTLGMLLFYGIAEGTLRRPPLLLQTVGSAFYLFTVVVITSALVVVRRRMQDRVVRASQALEETNRDLATALRTLQDTQARLVESEKLSALGRLLANLSHEINNPVTVIQNNLAPLRGYFDRAATALDEARRAGTTPADAERRWRELDMDFVRGDFDDAVGSMRTAVERIRAIHAELRAFVRGDAVMAVEADLVEGLTATVAMLQRSKPPGVTLRGEYGAVPRFKFRPGALNQVFFNLLQNGVDAVAERGEVVVRAMVAAGTVEITVTDSGPGVTAEARGHLFEPFFTTKAVGKGTGLGLAISYQIVQEHGGTIRLDAAHRDGARFIVRLPLAP